MIFLIKVVKMSLEAINERYMIEKRSPALLTVLGCGISSIVPYQP